MSDVKVATEWKRVADQLADALVQERRNSIHPDQLTEEALSSYVRAGQNLRLPTVGQEVSTQTEKWSWWVGHDGEHYTSECATREEAVQIARKEYEGGHIVEARKGNLRLASFFDADLFIEQADEDAVENHGDEDGNSIIDLSPERIADLGATVKAAIEEWQQRHDLTFKCYAFEATRNEEYIEAVEMDPDRLREERDELHRQASDPAP